MRILYITTIGSTMGFFQSIIRDLIDNGFTVDIAANDQLGTVPECYRKWGCKVCSLSCTRSPSDSGNRKAVKEIREIVQNGNYDIVHCHTPIAAMCTRIACRKLRRHGTKVIYTAHGFHFYKGAPLKNWLLYYPVEWLCAHWTDVLITINREDYHRAQKHMHAGRVEYVPGVGIDLQKFAPDRLPSEERDKYRALIGVGKEDKFLLSVGELNANKNHAVVIRALAKLQNPQIHYAIAGEGELHDELLHLAQQLGVGGQVHLLGFRSDVVELYRVADLYIHPSLREGLPVALVEAMASGLPCIASRIRGNTDLIFDSSRLFNPRIASELHQVIIHSVGEKVYADSGRINYKDIKKYDKKNIKDKMLAIYDE